MKNRSKDGMKVKELIEQLQKLPEDAIVILQKDAEGNGYSPVDDAEEAIYVAEKTWCGEVYSLDYKQLGYEPDLTNAEPCVVISPVY